MNTVGCTTVMWFKDDPINKGRCHVKNDQHGDPKTCDKCISAYRSCFKNEGNDDFYILDILKDMFLGG